MILWIPFVIWTRGTSKNIIRCVPNARCSRVRWVTKRLKRLMRKTKLGRRIFGDELPLVILPTSQMEQVGRIGNALTSSSTASFQSVKSVQPLSYDRSRPNATSSCTNVVTTAMVSASDTKQADP
ncbi:hypothetical protein M514_01286 [Trichuris suis]|uniref:Uncharacterized protein n=1 Tax=Trichuris suis TaxID=68888 RepID=A0A085MK70_9BILA|nr:hypothetical protein M513_01286 [Trichuris suis]KFD72301.1 hypothetical protein M514_01286 [Trichuris suis]